MATTTTITVATDETTADASTATAVPAALIPRGPVEASISFLQPRPNETPLYTYVEPPPDHPDQPARNYDEIPHKVHLTDIRTQPNYTQTYTLDNSAFQILPSTPTATSYETYFSDEAIKKTYYPEIEALLLQHVPGAHRVVIFDHTIRRQGSSGPGTRQPATIAHIDQTLAAAEARVRLHVEDPNEAERLLKGRVRVINVWRPINGTVISAPLAVAEPASVGEDEVVNIELRYPSRTGEITGIRFGEGQRWLYLSGMEGEERILLKCADSDEGAILHSPGRDSGLDELGNGKIAGRVPHSAFLDPRAGVGGVPAKPRESIEVRTLVFG